MNRAILALTVTIAIAALGRGQTPDSAPASQAAMRFVAIDIHVDSKSQPLAAYQIEFWDSSKVAKIVGIEGGQHAAYREPPRYDPAALQNDRVVLAAFNTGDDLPAGRTRIARLHLAV